MIRITGSGDAFCAGLDLSGSGEAATPLGVDLEAQVRLELADIRRCFETDDAQKARQAFFEKRAPRFRGR